MNIKWIILSVILATTAARLLIEYLNLRRLAAVDEVPAAFAAAIDADRFRQAAAYTRDKTRLGILEMTVTTLLLVSLVFGGPLAWFVSRCDGLTGSDVANGTAFFLGLYLVDFVVGLPFSWRRVFGVEKRYGFTTQGPLLWAADKLKSLVLGAVILAAVGGAVLAVLYRFPATWWLLAWLIVFVFGLLLGALYPVLVAPLFNRFAPLEDDALKETIRALMDRCGIAVAGVYTMDAGKRSKHSNAYFAGLGNTKRIVLFDTLRQHLSDEQVLAVLAHEAGHWKMKHTGKLLLANGLFSFLLFYLASLLLGADALYDAFGFDRRLLYGGLFLLGLVAQPVFFVLHPLLLALGRKYEYAADAFAVAVMGEPRPLREAIVGLCDENLANLAPHPVYVAFNYSHPPPVARVRRMAEAAAAE